MLILLRALLRILQILVTSELFDKHNVINHWCHKYYCYSCLMIR
ncbi:hypothetical protein A1OE_727 [Candidatus Endolissoclinum faulkneri L2]|uniref:Uncharacterized protein n=1 Tax=Candidatus Endolissoclinum faulkneri L2 TaxID=1193729 RepID=K7YQV8_9PROT|nr:hypothetical protein A1OE_727 [Candidatus Endolissoclinum faulkneri L2]